MKTLTITYNGVELFTGQVEEITFTHSDGKVSVGGKFTKGSEGRGLSGLADVLVQASKNKTEQRVREVQQ